MFFIRRPVREDIQRNEEAGKAERIGRMRVASHEKDIDKKAERSGNNWVGMIMSAYDPS